MRHKREHRSPASGPVSTKNGPSEVRVHTTHGLSQEKRPFAVVVAAAPLRLTQPTYLEFVSALCPLPLSCSRCNPPRPPSNFALACDASWASKKCNAKGHICVSTKGSDKCCHPGRECEKLRYQPVSSHLTVSKGCSCWIN